MGLRKTLSEYAPLLFSLVFCFIAAYCQHTQYTQHQHSTHLISTPLISHSTNFLNLPSALLVDGVMQVLTERRAQETRNLPPLPDLAHFLLPYIRW